MIPAQLLREIKHLELKAGFIANEILGGEYLSAFKGQGMEFDEIRTYVFGDDIRNIDWNVTARMNYPHIKIFREERELTLMLMIDVSASQWFGSGSKLKKECAAELAAVLAFLAIRNNDKVGLTVFSDRIEQYIPPEKGRGHVWHIIQSILTPQEFNPRTDFKVALDFLLKVTKRKNMCFLLSDFIIPKFPRSLAIAAKRHDLIAVQVRDMREEQLTPCGLLDFVDSESGQTITIDTSNKKIRAALQKINKDNQEKLKAVWQKNKIDTFSIDTRSSVARPLMHFFQRRVKKRSV